MSKLIKDKSGKTYTETEFRTEIEKLLIDDYINGIEREALEVISKQLSKDFGKSFDKSKIKTETKGGFGHVYYNNKMVGVVYLTNNNGRLGVNYLKTEIATGLIEQVKNELSL